MTDKTTTPKPSAVEIAKEQSNYLRGTLPEELHSDSDQFSEQNKQLLKFHGTYQQVDRDSRSQRRKDGLGKHYMFMVRCKIPGGRLTAEQYLAVDAIAGQFANGTLRITTRQGIQLHGVLKGDLQGTIKGINDCLLSTLGACGDVNRNVMVCPAPYADKGLHAQLYDIGTKLAAHFAPRSLAYHEIWLNGQDVGKKLESEELEPIYGKVYLPRKFKIGIALPDNNLIDIHAQDLGLLAIARKDKIVGWNVLVGGGMGMTHGNPATFPHLARPICFVPADKVVAISEAVIKLFRDHGNRSNRKRARIKYLIHDWGVEKFRDVLKSYVDFPLEDPKDVEVSNVDLLLGWHEQGDGKYWYGLSVENGRIKDEGDFQLRSALRKIMEKFQPEVRLTPQQDLLLCNVDKAAKEGIEKILKKYGVIVPKRISLIQQWSMACPAIPTCGLAISEAERTLPQIIDQLEVELDNLGLEKKNISVRMTGCPNGCARPYQSDIGIVGRSGEKYAVFLGGNTLGNRLNFLFQDLVPIGEIVPTLVPIMEAYREHRKKGECFGDFCNRMGAEQLHKLIPEEIRKPLPADHGPETNHDAGDKAKELLKVADRIVQENQKELSNGASKPAETKPLQASRQNVAYFKGTAGKEIIDYRLEYNPGGSVRETIIRYYGNEVRAEEAPAGSALVREAVYAGQIDPSHPEEMKKIADIYFTGDPGSERKDFAIEYHADGKPARTIVFYYEGDKRAGEVKVDTPIRRQEVFAGKAEVVK